MYRPRLAIPIIRVIIPSWLIVEYARIPFKSFRNIAEIEPISIVIVPKMIRILPNEEVNENTIPILNNR